MVLPIIDSLLNIKRIKENNKTFQHNFAYFSYISDHKHKGWGTGRIPGIHLWADGVDWWILWHINHLYFIIFESIGKHWEGL